jgi:hypothetical protein
MSKKIHPRDWPPPKTFKQLLEYMRVLYPEDYICVALSVDAHAPSTQGGHDIKIRSYVASGDFITGDTFEEAWRNRLLVWRDPDSKNLFPDLDITDDDLKPQKEDS